MMSDTEDEIWRSSIADDAPIDNPPDFASTEPPLEFAALFAQSQPENGEVSLSALCGLLNRSLIPNEKAARILEFKSDTERVSEHFFYWALREAARVQENEAYDIPEYGDGVVIEFGKERLTLHDDSGHAEHVIPPYNPTAPPRIRVALSSRDAGSYLFKHTVYSVSGELDGKSVKVLRRYRDFAALAEYLTRKYTFRVIPVLPPKRITLSGHYLVGGDQESFLMQRSAGLARFINLVVEHPVLSKDEIVAEFLYELTYAGVTKPAFAETDVAAVDPLFTSKWKPEQIKQWHSIEMATEDYTTQVTSLCLLYERQLRRMGSLQKDAEIMRQNFAELSARLHVIYPSLQEELPAIQRGLDSGTQYADEVSKNTLASKEDASAGPLEELKRYREMLVSVVELFKRIKLLGGNNIPELKKKITATQRRLAAASTKEDAREEELHKLRMSIQTSQNTIRELTNRDWRIKMIVTRELLMIQSMQFQLSKLLRSMAEALSDDLTRRTEFTNAFVESAESVPLKL